MASRSGISPVLLTFLAALLADATRAVAAAKVGQPVTIELTRDGAKASVKGTTTTDEMSGFIFAEAEKFPVKPVIAVLDGEGPVTVMTGKTETVLPEEGRAEELAKFAKQCRLD